MYCRLLLLSLLGLSAAGCGAPQASAPVAGRAPVSAAAMQAVLPFFDQQWAMRKHWEDGLAEVEREPPVADHHLRQRAQEARPQGDAGDHLADDERLAEPAGEVAERPAHAEHDGDGEEQNREQVVERHGEVRGAAGPVKR